MTARARGLGAGRALLHELAAAATASSRRAPCVLAAEVLDPNPARAFYERVGYRPVAYNARIDSAQSLGTGRAGDVTARLAGPRDALAIACLEGSLAARRRAAGDLRFDRPRAVDATMVGGIAAYLASDGSGHAPATLVTVDAGVVRAAATFVEHLLEPPFVPVRRALLGRIAIDPGGPVRPLVAPLLGLACRLALTRGLVGRGLRPPGARERAARRRPRERRPAVVEHRAAVGVTRARPSNPSRRACPMVAWG